MILPSHKYIFELFIQQLYQLDYDGVMAKVDTAIEEADLALVRDPSLAKVITLFAARLRNFQTFFTTATLTTNFRKDILVYRDFAEKFVAEKQLGQDVLQIINNELKKS